jgi:hypothetical protein
MRLAFILAVALAAAGCGTCQSPMQRAARHGVVLECRPGAKLGTTTCTVSTKAGDRDFTYRRSCE